MFCLSKEGFELPFTRPSRQPFGYAISKHSKNSRPILAFTKLLKLESFFELEKYSKILRKCCVIINFRNVVVCHCLSYTF